MERVADLFAPRQQGREIGALEDGGFVVTYRTVSDNTTYLQRFDAEGGRVGDPLEVPVPTGAYPQVTAIDSLSDGRFVVSFYEGDSIIYDPRDELIAGTAADDVITSRIDGAEVRGRGGADQLLGQEGDDILRGGLGRDELLGRDGADLLIGGRNADVLAGGLGQDILRGGLGLDTFVFDVAPIGANADTIRDFRPDIDTIAFDATLFAAFGATIDASEFRMSGRAQDADDFLLYNPGNGRLFYDFNGATAGGRKLVATLQPNLQLDADDFEILA